MSLELARQIAERISDPELASYVVNYLIPYIGESIQNAELEVVLNNAEQMANGLLSRAGDVLQDYAPDNIYSNYLDIDFIKIAKENELIRCLVLLALFWSIAWLYLHKPEEDSQIHDPDH